MTTLLAPSYDAAVHQGRAGYAIRADALVRQFSGSRAVEAAATTSGAGRVALVMGSSSAPKPAIS